MPDSTVDHSLASEAAAGASAGSIPRSSNIFYSFFLGSLIIHERIQRYIIACNELSLVLCHWSSFGFGIGNVLVSRFVSPFKCTVNTKLQKLKLPTGRCYATETSAIRFLFSNVLGWHTFIRAFSDSQKSNHGL